MKTTFRKITAISLAALTLACASCFTSFAAEAEKDNGYYSGDITVDYGSIELEYDDNGYTFYEEQTAYEDDVFSAEEYLACE